MRGRARIWPRAALIYLAGSVAPVIGSIQVAVVLLALGGDPGLRQHLLRALRVQAVALALVLLAQFLVLGVVVGAPALADEPTWIADGVVSALLVVSTGPVGLLLALR